MEMWIIDSQTGVLLNAEIIDNKLFYAFTTEQEVNDDVLYVLGICQEHKERIIKTVEANKSKNYNHWFFVDNSISFVVDYDYETYDLNSDGELVEMI